MSDRTDRIRGCLVADRWAGTKEVEEAAGVPSQPAVYSILSKGLKYGIVERATIPTGHGVRTAYWRLAKGESPPLPEHDLETGAIAARRSLCSEWRTLAELTGLPSGHSGNYGASKALKKMLERGEVERRENGKAYEWRLKP